MRNINKKHSNRLLCVLAVSSPFIAACVCVHIFVCVVFEQQNITYIDDDAAKVEAHDAIFESIPILLHVGRKVCCNMALG